MQEHSDALEFEKAQECKHQLETLEYLQQELLVQRNREHEEDVINYVVEKDIIRLQLFSYRNGVLQNKQQFKFDEQEDALDEFLKRYYDVKTPPRNIILPHLPEDDSLGEYLSQQTTYTVKFVVPQRGIKKQLLELVTENLLAEQTASERLAKELQELFATPKPVYTIDCFDISHHSGTSMVGSMVHFKNGKPLKSGYRRFRIQTVIDTIDDFRAMEEVVKRRYRRTLEGTMPPPDLIVIDGGRIQVDFAMKALEELGLEIPLVGLAKKFEEIYYPGVSEPERYNKKSEAMRTIIQARDEAHRFAITYYRNLKSKKTLEK
jgi:excinuclease ABC subunit C